MSADWGNLPLLAITCILEHAETSDALALMSVSRHYRSALPFYEGHIDILKLRLKHTERCLYVTKLFKRYAKRLHIYIDCNRAELDKFMVNMLPTYMEGCNLRELVFIGPAYLIHSNHAPIVKLNRDQIENMMLKHYSTLRTFKLLGCDMTLHRHESHKIMDSMLPVAFDPLRRQGILTPSIIGLDSFSSLHHLGMDMEHLGNANMNILSKLNLSRLTVTIGLRRSRTMPRLNWPMNIPLAINMVNLSHERLTQLMRTVLLDGLYVVSLKFMFCQTMHAPLLDHVVQRYKTTLQELVWADRPFADLSLFPTSPKNNDDYDMTTVNPLILLCWQCKQLRRLVLHGYWIWQYELVGLVRLRKSLEMLEVSAIYEHSNRPDCNNGSMMPVLEDDEPVDLDDIAVQQINEFTSFDWHPIPWGSLHPGLRVGSTPQQRACYVLRELGAR